MRRLSSPLRLLLLAAWAIGAFGAAPVIAPPVNQASYTLPYEAGYGIAQGGMFAIFGTEMGPTELASAQSLPLSTSLSGTSVRVTVNGETRDCFLIFTSAGQLAAILPSDTPLGEGQITVTYNGMTSTPQPILVVEHAVGMFTVSQDGKGAAVITDANYVPVSYVQSLAPGDIGIAWVTGLGARSTDDGPAEATDFKDLYDVSIGVGGIAANILYAGPSGCCAALGQIIFEVPGGGAQGAAQALDAADPENKRTGCNVPVVVQVGETFSKWTSVSVSDEGPVCNDPHGLTSEEIIQLSEGTPVSILSARTVGITTAVGDPLDAPTTALSVESPRDQVLQTEYFMQFLPQTFRKPSDYTTPAAGNCYIVDGLDTTDTSFGTTGTTFGANMEIIQEASVATSLEAEFGAVTNGVINVVTKSGGGSFDGKLDRAEFSVNGSQTPAAVTFRPADPFFNPVTDSGTFLDDVNAGNRGDYGPLGIRFDARLSHQNYNISRTWFLALDSIVGRRHGRSQVNCVDSASDPFVQAWETAYVGENRLAANTTAIFSELLEKFPVVPGVDGVLGIQEQVEVGASIRPSPTLSFTSTVSTANLREEDGRASLTGESGRAQSTGSCNVNVNNLGVAAGCSHNLPNAIGWGFWVVGSDQPFVSGPLQGETEFSAALGLQDWVPGQAASTTIPDLAEQGEVELRIWSETETLSGVLTLAP